MRTTIPAPATSGPDQRFPGSAAHGEEPESAYDLGEDPLGIGKIFRDVFGEVARKQKKR